MADKITTIDPFTNVPLIPVADATDDKNGGTFLSDLRELSVGDGGSNIFHANKQGIWLGSDKFAGAPFSVDMRGNCIANSIIITGYIEDGGAASDVNSYATTISGGKITTGSITANQIQANTITADKMNITTLSALTANLGTVTAGSISGVNISIGSGNSIFKADSNGIYLGNATFASAPFRVDMSGNCVATSLTLTGYIPTSGAANDINSYPTTVSGGKITAYSITADKMNVSYLSAIVADLGTVTAGTMRVSSYIGIQKSNGTPVAYLGQDPNSTGYWGFIAGRGYGLMCQYSSGDYFRVFMDLPSTDAVIALQSSGKLKFQDTNWNGSSAIMRVYGKNCGLTDVGGLDLFGALRLYTSSTPPTGATNGCMFFHTGYQEVWVFKGGAWKALQYVP